MSNDPWLGEIVALDWAMACSLSASIASYTAARVSVSTMVELSLAAEALGKPNGYQLLCIAAMPGVGTQIIYRRTAALH